MILKAWIATAILLVAALIVAGYEYQIITGAAKTIKVEREKQAVIHAALEKNRADVSRLVAERDKLSLALSNANAAYAAKAATYEKSFDYRTNDFKNWIDAAVEYQRASGGNLAPGI